MTIINFEHAKDGGVCYVQAQGVNAYQTPIELPTAAMAFQALEIEYTLDPFQKKRAAKTGDIGGAPGSIPMMRSGTWRVLTEVLPSGSGGTEMDAAILFLHGIMNHSVSTPTATTVSGAGSTIAVIDVADASGITAGDFVGFTDSSGNVHGRRIKTVNTAATPDNITVETPLTFTPADTTAVVASKTYTKLDDNHETAFTLWHKFTHGGVRLGGCVATDGKLIWGNNDIPQIEFSGFFREYAQARPTTLDGGIDNSQTAMVVDDWRGLTEGLCMVIEAEGANAAEVIYIDAEPTSTTITIERNKDAGGADAHGDAAVISVYEPSPTLAEGYISAKECQVYISLTNGAVSQLESESGSSEWAGGITARERNHGDTWKVHGYTKSSDFEAKTNFSTFAEKTTWEYFQHHLDGDERPMHIQCGDTTGTIFCLALSRQVLNPAAISPGDGHVVATLESMSRGARTGLEGFAVCTI